MPSFFRRLRRKAVVDAGVDVALAHKMPHLGAHDRRTGLVAPAPSAAVNHDQDGPFYHGGIRLRYVEIEAEKIRINAFDFGVADVEVFGMSGLFGHLQIAGAAGPPPQSRPGNLVSLKHAVAVTVKPTQQLVEPRCAGGFFAGNLAVSVAIDPVKTLDHRLSPDGGD